MVQDTINTTVDVETHKLWRIVAKKEGLSMIGLFRGLLGKQAKKLGVKVPKKLGEYVDLV